VFIFRFYQLQRFYRGSQYLQRWIGRLQVLRKRIIDAWMDTFHPGPPEILIFNKPCKWKCRTTGRRPSCTAAGCTTRFSEQPIVLFTVEEGFERWNNRSRVVHRDNFPLSDHLFTLMTIVRADLPEQHRERLTAHLAIRGIPLQNLHVRPHSNSVSRTFLRSSVLTGQSILSSLQPTKDLSGPRARRVGRQYCLLGS
jgi:hypothetical protein